MKTLKLLLFTFISITGMGSAMISPQNTKKSIYNTVYHAISIGAGSFVWTTTAPDYSLVICEPHDLAYCTVEVVTGYTPVDGQGIPEADIVGFAVHGIYR